MSSLLRPFIHPLSAMLLGLVLTACSDPRAYAPLAPGRWWVYAVASTVLDETREARYVARNVARGSLEGKEVVARRVQASSLEYLRSTPEGILRVAQRSGRDGTFSSDQPPRLVLPVPAQAGRSWSVASTLALIESRTFARQDRVIVRRYPVTIEKSVVALDGVTQVPAGRFANCLLIAGQGTTSVRTDRGNASARVTVSTREWYAPGVGLVRLERDERSTSPFLKSGRQVWTLLEYGD
ncbi:MAG: hypothetical protein RLW61_02390 [Gammaproteobacteria bacterium]